MGILINNMKIIHTSTFTIIHTNLNHYLETNTKKTKRNNNTLVTMMCKSKSECLPYDKKTKTNKTPNENDKRQIDVSPSLEQ
jgi:hypothetical protein